MKTRVISMFFLLAAMPITHAAEGILDYNRFMTEIEPLLLTQTYSSPGPGLMSCFDCHGQSPSAAYTAFPLLTGQSRANFTEVGRQITLSDPDTSPLLLKPLALAAGGIPHGTGNNGGEQFPTVLDANYQTILNWIIDATRSRDARITQTEPHPNPFRFNTDIVYYLSTPALSVTVTLFTNDGHELIHFDGPTLVGANKVNWNGRDRDLEPMPTGIYFYAVRATFEDETVVKQGSVVYTP